MGDKSNIGRLGVERENLETEKRVEGWKTGAKRQQWGRRNEVRV